VAKPPVAKDLQLLQRSVKHQLGHSHQPGALARSQASGGSSYFADVWKRLKRNRYLYLLLALPIIYFVLFKYGPMYGMQIAFRNYRVRRGIWGSEWVGLQHFVTYLSDPEFWVLVRNTFRIGIAQVAFGFPIPIIFALLVNELPRKGAQRVIQNISYLPHFISVVVIASMVTIFLSRDGIINQLIVVMGGQSHIYMQDSRWFLTVFVTSGIWQSMGWNAIIYSAALTTVDPQLYDAAVVDGAGRWKQTLNVTIPSIRPTIAIMFILTMGGVLNVSFEKALLFQNALTYDVSDIISTFIYRQCLTASQYSYGSAVDMFSTVINFVFLLATNWFVRKMDVGSLW
jgi:putative aldouronate transport system permease protein